ALLTIAAPALFAQGVTGSAMTGTVKNQGGEPVAGATVMLRNTATGAVFTGVSGPNGAFFIDNVPPGGPYELTTAAEGYQANIQQDIVLSVGQRMAANITLRPPQVEEIVVTARRFDQNADRGRTGASTVVRNSTIQQMPLSGRNFTDLIGLDPRISSSSVNGQNNRYNNIQIDGGANNDLFGLAASGTPGGQANAKPLSVEALQEFVVQVAPFDVRYGNFAGGLINAITKSGTNDFHGAVYGYTQQKALANQNRYINGQNVTDPNFGAFHTWQYGAVLGGPIVKDKAHFFVSVDLQSKSAPFGGQFNMTGDDVTDAKNVGITKADVDRFNTILAKYGITNQGSFLAPNLGNPDRNVFAKVTTSVIPNSELEISYNFVNANSDVLIRAPFTAENSNPGGLRDGYELSNAGYFFQDYTNTGRAKLTTNWDEGHLSNEFLGGFQIIRDQRTTPTDSPLIFVQAPSGGWLAAGQERFSQANELDQNIFQLQDNVTFSQQDHRITLGSSNEFFNFRNVFLQGGTGVWGFSSLDALDAGTPFAFQRNVAVSSLTTPGTTKFRVAQFGLYLQDEWQVLQTFSVTPGIRMDVPYLSNAVQNPKLLTSPLNIDTSRVPSGNPLVSPRLGFNWDVKGNADTIVRGGGGIFSGRPPYVWVSNAYLNNGLAQVEIDCGSSSTKTLPTFTADPKNQPSQCPGVTPTAANTGEVDYYDPNTKYPQNLRAALGADQRLPFDMVFTVDFLYERDVNGWYFQDTNLVPQGNNGEGRTMYGTTNTNGTATAVRADKTIIGNNFAIKTFNMDGGHTGSATFQLQKQFGRRYGVSVAYTYSRSYDRMSLTSSIASSNYRFNVVDGTLDGRHITPSDFDRPHKLTVSGTAALPYGFGVGLSYVGVSGTPYTWVTANDVNGDGVSQNDLMFVPSSPSQISLSDTSGKMYTDLQSFISSQSCLNDAKGGFVGRNACRNPWADFIDLRISWNSPSWKGGQHIEAQWDIFNVLNLINPQWGHFDQVAQFENATPVLSAVAYDAANKRPVYKFTPLGSIISPVYSSTLSRWRMQLGARYVF
ncbi:MAG: TonB-dependent receptor, partial [Myxococcales bacterium]